MRRWLVEQFGTVEPRPLILIDPAFLVSLPELAEVTHGGPAVEVHDWFSLRQAWERHGRRPNDSGRVVLLVRDPDVAADVDVPFDIAIASCVRRIRLPVPAGLRDALLVLDDDCADAAVNAIKAATASPAQALLAAAAGLVPGPIVGRETEFVVALRLVSSGPPPPIRSLAQEIFVDPLATALVADPPAFAPVQDVWASWLAEGERSPWHRHIEVARAELTDLFLAGQLVPAATSAESIPAWAMVGVAQPSVLTKIEALLEAPPPLANDLDDWIRTAQWWGEVRSALAQLTPSVDELEQRAWDWWQLTDQRFLGWLRRCYGRELTRAWTSWPRSLDKVQPFLAKRRSESAKTLLVVLDGMGFTQWTRLRELVQPTIREAGGVLAMLPTLTEVSRQAIAAASIPSQFADSIRTTSKEPQRWAAAWDGSGARPAWIRIDGAHSAELNIVPFGYADVIGIVLSITDELMHANDLLGDVGLHAGLEGWARAGVLDALLRAAADHGYETWLTADHGNLAVAKTREVREGEFVERAGTRTRRYGSKTLRNASAVDGIAWDDLPGYPPAEAERLLFAPGRTGWGPARLSHGGLSLDEVIVPLVRVEPKR